MKHCKTIMREKPYNLNRNNLNIMNFYRNPDLTLEELGMLSKLFGMQQDTLNYESVSILCGCTQSKVRKIMHGLINKGYITSEREWGGSWGSQFYYTIQQPQVGV